MFQLIFTALGAEFCNADTGGIVNDQTRFSDNPCTLYQSLPVLIVQLACAQLLRVHIGFHGKHTVDQLLLTHLQTEDGHGEIPFKCHIPCQVQHKGSLTHGRTGCNQHQIRGLQPCRAVIQIQEPGGNACDASSVPGRHLNLVHGIHNHLADGHVIVRLMPLLHQLKDTLLRILQDAFQAFFSRITGVGDLLIETDQTAQRGFLPHNARIIFYVGRGKRGRQQLPDKLQTAHLRGHILGLQAVLQRHQVHRTSPVVQLPHGLKEDSVLLIIEVIP